MKNRLFGFTAPKFRRIPLTVFLIFCIIVAVANTTYYFSTEDALIKQQEEKMQLISDNISYNITLSRHGQNIIEDMIGQNLRTAALAAQAQLDPDIEKVQNDTLRQISEQLGIDHITLMKRSGDDIIGYKSSDPKEINMSTKGWRGYWFQAFNELLDNRNTTVPVGQKLPNYWAGPINTSQTNPNNVDKWGYYFDGTTNYIIDPFVHDTIYRKYQKETGVDALINKILANPNGTEGAIQIAVLNPPIYLGQQEQYKKNNVVWYSDREVYFGSNTMQGSKDKDYVTKAIEEKHLVSYTASVDGKPVLKTFIPLKLNFPVVVDLTSDLNIINKTVNQELANMIIITIVLTLASLLIFWITMRFANRSKEEAVQSVQDVFVGNIETLFNSIKEQRHDFNHQVAAIQSMVLLEDFEELKKFTEGIVGETKMLNDIININSPAISALIQTKIAQALKKNITFEHKFENLGNVGLTALQASEMVKILGNLIDNAFDAVLASSSEEKIIRVQGSIGNQNVKFTVYDNGDKIPEAIMERIFEPGYTTKNNEKNSGLGLSIVKKMIQKNAGNIEVNSNDEGTIFTIHLPL